ncbi:DUF305 domain-containing protein [Plantactinospora sp. CA-290183]|uniref:DUF305 domain-containing protein n=1 Tax=Plantactinospora sp. CA-290183 TaxID=3240006 RepID=UPI003D90F60E
MVLASSENRRGPWLVVALVEVVAVALAGLGGIALNSLDPAEETPSPQTRVVATTPAPSPPAGTAPVVVPGRPGESAQVLPPDQLPQASGPTYNSADVRFALMMIPHHGQALEMTRLVPERAGSAGVIAVADRIRASQQPEVEIFNSWLRDRGLATDPDRPSGHDHGVMHGMQSPEAISGLTAATGTAFDRMFIQMMTAHHQGAIQMAQEVLVNGIDRQLRELARNIAFEQAVEIDRMRDVLANEPR